MYLKLTYITLFFFVISAGHGQDKNPLIIKDSIIGNLIGENVLYHFESSKNSIEYILDKDPEFKLSDQRALNLGATRDYVWLKIPVTNKTRAQNFKLYIAYPIIDEVTFFYPTETGRYDSLSYWEEDIFSRENVDPDYVFDLTLKENESAAYFIRLKMTEQVILPIYIQDDTTIDRLVRNRSFWNGIYAGVALIMFLYNSFIYLSTRDQSYLWYVGYVFFIGLTHLWIKGYSINFVHESFSVPGNFLTTTSCFAIMFALLFTRSFLNTRKLLPKMDKGISVMVGLIMVTILIDLFVSVHTGFLLMQIFTGISIFYILIAAYYLMYNKKFKAYYFSAGWTILLIGSIVFLAKDTALLPYNMFTSYIMQVSSGLEMTILSFALASRINTYRKEKEEAREKEISALKENERLVQNRKIELEKKVKERTRELQDTNVTLNEALDELKSTQTQLVDQEKMASLGQLTAGIAHEINNPINFVTSNVMPLKRDVEDVFVILDKYMALKNAEDFEKEIGNIKSETEELELDFVRDEIFSLLSGIDEGARRTAEIVRGLKVFSRAEEQDVKRVDLIQGLESTLTLLNSSMKNEVTLKKEYEPIPQVECYAGKVNQVFMNILSNAVQALNEHKKEGEKIITVRSKNLGDSVEIQINDNGPGIPDDVLDRIFEPFYTSKDVGEGTGLGLSISKSIIAKHKGELKVESKVGEGTTFFIILPKILEDD